MFDIQVFLAFLIGRSLPGTLFIGDEAFGGERPLNRTAPPCGAKRLEVAFDRERDRGCRCQGTQRSAPWSGRAVPRCAWSTCAGRSRVRAVSVEACRSPRLGSGSRM